MVCEETIVIKLEIKADPEAINILDGQSKICNWLYNHLLQKAYDLRECFSKTHDTEIAKILYTERGLRNLLPEIKEEKQFLKVVHSSPLKKHRFTAQRCYSDASKIKKRET